MCALAGYLCNRRDASNPDTRARPVACEVDKTGKEDAFYASTTPSSSKKASCSMYESRRNNMLVDGTEMPMRLRFIDMKKAYFNGVPSRLIFMSLPPEVGLPQHFVAKQTRCVYGTRDADILDFPAACQTHVLFTMLVVTFLWWCMGTISQLWAQMQTTIGTLQNLRKSSKSKYVDVLLKGLKRLRCVS